MSSLKRLSLKTWTIIICLFLLLIVVAFISGGVNKLVSEWNNLSEDQEGIEELQRFGLNNKVSLIAEDNGVRVTITHVVADDIQTFVYYEVEDLEEDRLLKVADYWAVKVSSDQGVLDYGQGFREPVHSIVDRTDEMGNENKYKGRIGILPIANNQDEIELEISGLYEVEAANVQGFMIPKEHNPPVNGEWLFTIPIEKEEIFEKQVDVNTEIDGYNLNINKVTIAPTVTFVHFQYKLKYTEGWTYFYFDQLKSEESILKRQDMSLFPVENVQLSEQGITEYAPFESIYYNVPEGLDLHLALIQETIEADQSFPIDWEQDGPQLFEFMDTELSIEYDESQSTNKLVINQEYSEKREYERANFHIVTEPESYPVNYSSNGIYIDEEGKQHEGSESDYYHAEMEKLRYFSTQDEVIFEPYNGELVKPVELKIDSYIKTTVPSKNIHLEF
ncbi:DUF4179 domain-containing protein [Aquibacillus rhizosphaerae]|uniref:DUF4179 domain-containing protein n=1 Tax=Aquibacillus rhizosphaerae TaxID=3051431 RepID=A0ABT7L3F6_9BACI|nr:DUF4179 domain-containing protein [Aquibacillus sp. LR5S19]MDL4839737.1 DUF4179 domain-containing protein [Aquibacillus sp. LR5S19]